tara:strand:- start:88989 stop:89924 length:936 start_codon:yes stop_codon:yes gene_type:complete
MSRIIALTGATGFVGGHLLEELLSHGYTVNALTRRPQQARKNVKWISGDLENRPAISELVDDVDVIINAAGLIKAKSQKEFIAANSDSVSTLIKAVKSSHKKPHFIQVSTLAAREAAISDYAMSKHQGEIHLQNNKSGINWTIVRPPGVYGPKDSETLKIFKALTWRVALSPSNSTFRVSWIHVSDLAKAISHVIENRDYYDRTIELDDGHGNGYSHKEFYATASKILNLNPLYITLPKFTLKSIGHINDIVGRMFGYAPMLSAMKVNEMCHPDWVCRKETKTQITGWVPEHDLESGLKETLDWYKKNNYI